MTQRDPAKNPDENPDADPNSDPNADKSRRIRLRRRQGSEHQFRFARRWDAHRKARSPWTPWVLIGFDAAVLVFIVLLLRILLGKLD